MMAWRCGLGVGLVMAATAPAWCASPPPGAASCSGCHASPSAKATAASSALPNIYGRDAEAMRSTLLAFRTGSTDATVMTRIAKGFSDDELTAIAQWLAVQK